MSKAQLSHASLHGANLESATFILADLLGTVLNEARLAGASFFGAFLFGTRLKSARLNGANLLGASLMGADLSSADLSGAHLMGANFHEANLQNAVFKGANLTAASLVGSHVQGAVFEDCNVHGVSAWNLEGIPKTEKDLALSLGNKSLVVDRLELAQILSPYLFSAGGSRFVERLRLRCGLIAGRFSGQRIAVYEVIRTWVERSGWTPIRISLENPGDWKTIEYLVKLIQITGIVLLDLSGLGPFRSRLESLEKPDPAVPLFLLRDTETAVWEKWETTDAPSLVYQDPVDLESQLLSRTIPGPAD